MKRPLISQFPETVERKYELTFRPGETSASFEPQRPFRAFNIWKGRCNAQGRMVLDHEPLTDAVRSIAINKAEQLIGSDEPGFGIPVDAFASAARPVHLQLSAQQPGHAFVITLTAPARREFTLTVAGRELAPPEGPK